MELRLSTDTKIQNTDVLMQTTAAKLLLRGQLESGLCLNKGQKQPENIKKVGHLSGSSPYRHVGQVN